MNHDNDSGDDDYDEAHDEFEDDDDDDDEGPDEGWLSFFQRDDDDEDDAMDDMGDDAEEGDDAESNSIQQQQQQSTLPLPREHSYLAGASHPLVVRIDGDHPRPSSINHLSSPSTAITELAILELQGVVLFPGSTIPVKLRDPSLITYLGHQIEVCRTVPHRQPKVCLGIVTYQSRPRHDDDSSRNNNDNTQQHHRLVGRIGTIATIQYTQERIEASASSASSGASAMQPHVWGRYQELNELVFTAVGTGRLEVLGPTSNGSCSVFYIRELEDVPLVPPPMGRLFTTNPSPASSSSSSPPQDQQSALLHEKRLGKHDQLIWNLSQLTPIPYFVYQRNWPWRIKDELILLLQENQGRSNLPQLSSASATDTDPTTPTTTIDHSFLSKSPTQFSYWLSGNMPFTQSERLELLQMTSTLERLRLLRQKILALIQQRRMCYVGCARCSNPLAPVSEIFSFDGAEGATSNYVNDHGYIHQITTLRSVVDERHLHFQGPPSTSNRQVYSKKRRDEKNTTTHDTRSQGHISILAMSTDHVATHEVFLTCFFVCALVAYPRYGGV